MIDAQARIDRFLDNVLWGVDEKTRQSYLQQQENTSNWYLSLLARLNEGTAAQDAGRYALNRKGVLLRIASEINIVARSGRDPALSVQVTALNTRRQELSHLVLAAIPGKRERIAVLEREIKELEAAVGLKAQGFARAKTVVNTQDITRVLKPDDVLVDFLVYQNFDLKTGLTH